MANAMRSGNGQIHCFTATRRGKRETLTHLRAAES